MKGLIFLGWMALVGAAMGSSGPMLSELQPYEVNSPAGTFFLKVNPSSPDGAGPSDCALVERESGKVVWERRMDHTFRQAMVDEEGRVGGIAYTIGPMGSGIIPERDIDGGEFVIEILDEKGAVQYSERTRRSSGLMTEIGEPYARGVLFDEENGRMIVRMSRSPWRVYELWSGELLSLIDPTPRWEETRRYVAEARWIPRTPLLLVQWFREPGEENMGGARFGVLDAEGQVIWELDRERRIEDRDDEGDVYWKYKILSVEALESAPLDPFAKGSVDPFAAASDGVREEAGYATFEVGLGEEGKRVTFSVLKSDEKWRVREEGRKAWVAPPAYQEPEEKPVPKDVPRLKAEFLEGFQLGPPGGGKFEKLVEVVFGAGRFAVVPFGGSEVLVYDENGKFLHACVPEEGDFRGETFPFGRRVSINAKGEVFLPVPDRFRNKESGESEDNPRRGQALRFSATGERMEEAFSVGSDYSWGQEWYFQPGTERVLVDDYQGLRFSELQKKEGAVEQRIGRGADGGWLTSVSDVAFAKNGSFVANSHSMPGRPGDFMPVPPGVRSGEVLDVFDASGKPVRTIGIERYVNGFPSFAFDGERIVFCNGGSDVYVMAADGTMLGAFPVDFGQEEVSLELSFDGSGDVVVANRVDGSVKRYRLP